LRSRRPRTSLIFVGMGIVLLAAILIGQQIGDHTLFSATERRLALPDTITPVPDATMSDAGLLSENWKKAQVVSVATDPAFPDPRVTPPPTPTPRPTPSPKPTPRPTPTPAPDDVYTSPPLPVPIASHDPDDATPTPIP
jgi:hypothetical protein